MKTVAGSFIKLVVSYFAVVFAIILLPVFLLTSTDVSAFDSVMNFLFSNKN